MTEVYGQVNPDSCQLHDGLHGVGFRHYTIIDSSRLIRSEPLFDQDTFRKIQVSLWYPVSADSPQEGRMTIEDYLNILKREDGWTNLPPEMVLGWFGYQDSEERQKLASHHLKAEKDASMETGEYPAVIYAPGLHATSIENFILCEYLASCGYVVISSPSAGANSRYMESAGAKDIDTQTRDLEVLFRELCGMESVDRDQVALMGHSFGAIAAVILAMKNPLIKAVVSLDGSVKYQYEKLIANPYYDVGKFVLPFMHLSQKDIPEAVLSVEGLPASINDEFIFYDSLYRHAAYRIKFHTLTHNQFTSLGLLYGQRDPLQDKSDPEIMRGYVLLQESVKLFLDAYLKSDAMALKTLEAGEVGSEDYSFKESKTGVQLSDVTSIFINAVRESNFETIPVIYDSLRLEYPWWSIRESDMNIWGLTLTYDSDAPQSGATVLEWATGEYPNSSNLFDSLGESYLFIGDIGLAIESFEKAVALDPGNQNAKDRIKQITEK